LAEGDAALPKLIEREASAIWTDGRITVVQQSIALEKVCGVEWHDRECQSRLGRIKAMREVAGV
jgi:hypothetical protein